MGSNKAELKGLLDILPHAEFACIYGSSLLPNNPDKSSMVDYIVGVSDPMQWHSQNLEMNKDHYSSLMVYLGGAKLITQVADEIGVGVHFNPYVKLQDRMVKYGVVRMHDLVQDILKWEHFYLSGRLQKPVSVLLDNLDIEDVNSVNLKAAASAALLLLPPEFSEEELYVKICGLSYMGDLRMLFAEDRNKVKKIINGQYELFQKLYKPVLEEYAAKDLLHIPSSGACKGTIVQDYGLSATRSLVSSLPSTIRSCMGTKLGQKKKLSESGRLVHEVIISSRGEAAECMRKVLRRIIFVSSTRQAISGLVTVGGVNAARYVATKMARHGNRGHD